MLLCNITERPVSSARDDDVLEGMLGRKHEWESTAKKASDRAWNKLYAVLQGGIVKFYKDQKTYRTSSEAYYKSENPIDLLNATVNVADDYTKKKHVFRLKLSNGGEYLLQGKDDAETREWVNQMKDHIATLSADTSASASRSQTLPAGSSQHEERKKKGGFFTMKKN
jgi:spectrin beta